MQDTTSEQLPRTNAPSLEAIEASGAAREQGKNNVKETESAPAVAERTWGHMLELDGIRGIAILLVLVFHSARHAFSVGWMGVDLFFVLSGFLITLGLLKTAGRPHYFRNFYVKRALRIWPIYYLLLLGVYLLSPNAFGQKNATWDWVAYALYIQNLMHPLESPVELGQMWSLAIEEQFYLVWPFVVWLAPRAALIWISGGMIVAALALRLLLIVLHAPAWIAYFSTPCRLDALALGALLSLLVTGSRKERALIPKWAPVCAVAGGVVSLPIALLLGSEGVSGALHTPHEFTRAGLFSLVGVMSFGMVGLAVNGHGKALSGFLCSPWLRYLGKISYGLYIYHAMVFQTVHLTVSSLVSDPEAPLVKLMRATIGIALAVALASVSWYAVEQPLLRLKSVFVKGEAGRA